MAADNDAMQGQLGFEDTGDGDTLGEMTFNQGLTELEQIIRDLESGRLALEESLQRYERGVGLLRSLQEKISQAEQKVTVLLGEIEPESSDDVDKNLS